MPGMPGGSARDGVAGRSGNVCEWRWRWMAGMRGHWQACGVGIEAGGERTL